MDDHSKAEAAYAGVKEAIGIMARRCNSRRVLAGLSEWVQGSWGSVYLRVCTRQPENVHGISFKGITVANISVSERHQDHGIGRAIIAAMESSAQELGIPAKVENVLNPVLESALRRWGYTMSGGPDGLVQAIKYVDDCNRLQIRKEVA